MRYNGNVKVEVEIVFNIWKLVIYSNWGCFALGIKKIMNSGGLLYLVH